MSRTDLPIAFATPSRQLGLARRLALLVALFGFVASACGGASSATTASAQGPAPLSGEFEIFGGGQVDLEALAGEDVVLWFWAPW